jgi:hypothetical protein
MSPLFPFFTGSVMAAARLSIIFFVIPGRAKREPQMRNAHRGISRFRVCAKWRIPERQCLT